MQVLKMFIVILKTLDCPGLSDIHGIYFCQDNLHQQKVLS